MENKVLVITGASSGIGAALARKAGSAGASVVLAARRQKELAEVAAESGPSTLIVQTDVTARAEVFSLAKRALDHFGHVDVWINNAGRGITRLPSELSDDDLDLMFRDNVKSALYGVQAILPHFKARDAGQIINVSSVLGRIPYVAFRSAYCAAKHALNAITAALRAELRASHPGIVVTTVLPGPVATEFGVNALHGGNDSRAMPGAQTPEEVADVILDAITHARTDVYTRPQYAENVKKYYSDMDAFERTSFLPPPKNQ